MRYSVLLSKVFNSFAVSVIILLVSPCFQAKAQTLIVSFPDTIVYPGVIAVPVKVTGNAHISSFSLHFLYYNGGLNFLHIQNVNPSLTDTISVTHIIGGATDWVELAWNQTTAASLSSGILFEAVFDFISGGSPLTWNTWTSGYCEFIDPFGTPVSATFVDGSITEWGLHVVSDYNPFKLMVFPNPVHDGLCEVVIPSRNRECVLRVTDLYGREVLHYFLKESRNALKVNLEPGIYFFETDQLLPGESIKVLVR